MAKFQVNILGCGSATPSARHQPSCQVVDFRDKLFMIDCGEGAQSSFRRMGLKFSRLGHIFISHLHGDHVFGLPGLLSTMSLHGVQGKVTIHVFREGAALLKSWMDFFNRQSSFEIVYDIINPGERRVIYEDSGLTVETFPLYHRIACTGFLFREKPKMRHLRGDMVKFYSIPVSQLASIKQGADYVTPDGTVIANERLTTPPDPSVSYAYCSDTMYDPHVAADIRVSTRCITRLPIIRRLRLRLFSAAIRRRVRLPRSRARPVRGGLSSVISPSVICKASNPSLTKLWRCFPPRCLPTRGCA